MILHDHHDAHCITILRNLREAAMPTTQLVIVDSIVPYACNSNTEVTAGAATAPPAPLLANLGQASVVAYLLDIQMMGLLGGQERTAVQLEQLLAASGWKMVHMYKGTPFSPSDQKVVAVPV